MKMKSRISLLFGLLLVFALVLSACVPAPAPVPIAVPATEVPTSAPTTVSTPANPDLILATIYIKRVVYNAPDSSREAEGPTR